MAACSLLAQTYSLVRPMPVGRPHLISYGQESLFRPDRRFRQREVHVAATSAIAGHSGSRRTGSTHTCATASHSGERTSGKGSTALRRTDVLPNVAHLPGE